VTGLPAGWQLRCLSEIAHITLGQSPPSASYNTAGLGLPFFQGKAEFGDRVEFGDDIAHQAMPDGIEFNAAGFPTGPVDDFERPAPDATGDEPRSLSEAQFNLLLNLRDDEVTALEMAAELVGVYQAINGEKPAYGIQQSVAGRWERITDIQVALKREYLKARKNWLRKQSEARDAEASRFSAEGSQTIQQQIRSQRAKVLGAF